MKDVSWPKSTVLQYYKTITVKYLQHINIKYAFPTAIGLVSNNSRSKIEYTASSQARVRMITPLYHHEYGYVWINNPCKRLNSPYIFKKETDGRCQSERDS